MLHRLYDILRRGAIKASSATVEKWFSLPASGGALYAYGTAEAPTGAGYAAGCIYVQTDGADNTVLYVNTGTATTASFKRIDEVSALLGLTIPTGQTLAVTDADKLTVGGVIVPQFVNITHKVVLTNNLGEYFFIADRAYTVVSIKEIHAVAATNPNVLKVRKCLAAGTELPGAAAGANCVEFITAGFDTQAAAATAQSGTLAVTTIAAGDKLAVLQGADVTGLVGEHISLKLQAA